LAKKKIKSKSVSDQPNGKSDCIKTVKSNSLIVDFLYIITALLFTFLLFMNTTKNEFVNWDDDKNVYENAQITTLNDDNFWKNTVQIFQTPVIGNYNPLTIWTFLIENKIYGLDNPAYWHFTNVFLHLISVLLVFLIGRKLKLSPLPALLFTLLFAIHPMRVESVAWITERKDVLFGAFYLLGLHQYINYRVQRKTRTLLVIYLCFILALLSKIQAVILPVSMLLLDYYFDGKIDLKKIKEKIPFFFLSLLTGLLGIYFLQEQGSIENATANFPIWQRLFIGSFSYCVYIIKSIIPYELSPLYPYPSSLSWYYYVSIISVPLSIYALYKAYNKDNRTMVFGLLFFISNILFLLQILGAGQGFLADRFTYIAHIGLYFIIAKYVNRLLGTKMKTGALMGSTLILMVFSYMTFRQNEVWKNSETLWTHVLKYYDNTPLPYGNRANYRRDYGNIQGALEDYNKALALKDNPQTYNSRARLYFDHSNNRDTLNLALSDYSKAIELSPEDGEFYTNRGATYARLGDLDRALTDLTSAIKYKPDHQVAYLNRSIIYNMLNRKQEAIADMQKYITLNPYNPDIYYELARIYLESQQFSQALTNYNQSVQLNPNKGVYYYGRSKAHYYLNDRIKATTDLQMAEQLNYSGIEPSYKQTLLQNQ
jgi:tetratricopeptide (TPR) repeat protein